MCGGQLSGAICLWAIRLAWHVSLMLSPLPVHSGAHSVAQGCLRAQECHSSLDSGETVVGKGLQPHVDSVTYLRDTVPTLTTSSAESTGSGIVGVNGFGSRLSAFAYSHFRSTLYVPFAVLDLIL